MDKGKLFSGLAIMVGLVVLGLMIPRAVSVYRSYDRTVDVKGLCEREVKADRVIWPITYKVMADDIRSIYSQLDGSVATIKDFLLSGGISEDEISVSVPSVSDKLANEYGENQRTFRYIAKNVVTSIYKAFSKKSTIHFSYCLENIFSLFINRNAIQIKRRYFNFFCRIIYKTYKNLLT